MLSIVENINKPESPDSGSSPLKMRFSGRIVMTPKQWYAVPVNPVQRDTEARAKRAVHLHRYSPAHSRVEMAVLRDGSRFKLDGHTRAHLWESGQVVPPPEIMVDVYACDDLAAVEELYGHFDNKLAVDTAGDLLAGAARRASLEFKSPFMRSHFYGHAVKTLYAATFKVWNRPHTEQAFVLEAVSAYKPELSLLDGLHPTKLRFPGSVVMGTLATFRRRGASVLPFWEAYSRDEGVRNGKRCDAVQALTEALNAARRQKRLGIRGVSDPLFARCVAACEGWRRHETYTTGVGGGVRGMSEERLRSYIRVPAGVQL